MLYSGAGFHGQTILIDIEFNKIKPLFPQLVINTSATQDHVAEVCHIQALKEKCHCIISVLPVGTIPNILIIHASVFDDVAQHIPSYDRSLYQLESKGAYQLA